MDTLRITIGEKIRDIRKRKGLTQQQLADKAQLMYQYIGAVERGTRNITLDSLAKIIAALDVDLDSILPLDEGTRDNLKSNEKNDGTILWRHHQLLKSRSIREVETLHRITKEIFSLIPDRKV
ncbi:helix-turn-helix domain-containing protein [Paenibacillus melissococcoides]|uniref:Helix-turn-helix domain-containing protein n=1 Tax=Paenibacillus melissococcoides TaxID=2912268 RepID=A0ABN8UAI1_9BACL|nr:MULTISPECIES: helix-turn-helix transcriptional regulator [Paenibacillus]MEB9897119.1 helix-turn-helix transcriptional regulator [Bacillus cereus]CAH8248204.1 helix-turn-helix domain-containing protein [Paenibacillus melissococcoides]CAH8718167.1 helix-turn-helix domain-containing protein [Paenibacillus melissococcoides]CAH8718954.1 helix-turn-helix domain-containing protein [Paenibacillus melissococcoides]GIO82346.1 hypothetical protein J6TS7_59560 [Paenibacillus dendritiformis]